MFTRMTTINLPAHLITTFLTNVKNEAEERGGFPKI